MNLKLKKIKSILALVSCIFTFSIFANSHTYLLKDMIENSKFIGEVSITSKKQISNDSEFSCGYEYSFANINDVKGNTNTQVFWSISEDFNVNDNYQIFLMGSSVIIDSRIADYKSRAGDEVDDLALSSFQQCKQITPKFGISAYGSGSFIIKSTKNNTQYININKSLFFSSNLYKKCSFRSDRNIKKIKLSCFQSHIKSVLQMKQSKLQQIYDGIIKQETKESVIATNGLPSSRK